MENVTRNGWKQHNGTIEYKSQMRQRGVAFMIQLILGQNHNFGRLPLNTSWGGNIAAQKKIKSRITKHDCPIKWRSHCPAK